MREPQRITVAGKEMTVPQVRQSSYEVRARRVDALTRILDAETPQSAMIFCRTKAGVDELGERADGRGYGSRPSMAISRRPNATGSCAASVAVRPKC